MSQLVKETILLTATYYRVPISEPVLEMYVEDLSEYSPALVAEAYKTYRKNHKNKFFPLPAQIIDILNPTVSADAEARDAVEKIKTAIRDFGYTRLMEAKQFMGPVAWEIVRSNGGWTSICESDFIHNPAALAQARNRAEDIVRNPRVFGSSAYQLEAPQRSGGLEHASQTFADILKLNQKDLKE